MNSAPRNFLLAFLATAASLLNPLPSPASAASALEHIWSEAFGGTDVDIPHSVAVDASGNVYIAGSFVGTADFGLVLLMPDMFPKRRPRGDPQILANNLVRLTHGNTLP